MTALAACLVVGLASWVGFAALFAGLTARAIAIADAEDPPLNLKQ